MPAHQVVFSGDCLFKGSIGRTDLPGGDLPTLMRSIFDVLLPLGDDVTALSGHGDQTTLGEERQSNPFLVGYRR
jgi:glyoxylase-like metal-dependent hydrolase (beta-lactamase superfamily II)